MGKDFQAGIEGFALLFLVHCPLHVENDRGTDRGLGSRYRENREQSFVTTVCTGMSRNTVEMKDPLSA